MFEKDYDTRSALLPEEEADSDEEANEREDEDSD